jgi:hypothetical protein
MARARNIKPGFFSNEDLVEFDFATRLLFIGLWTVADREGRLQDRPKKIKIDVFPADNLDVDAMLSTLHNGGFINRYEVDGAKFIQITNWIKHQNPHHTERASEIPASNGALTVKQPLEPKHAPSMDGGNLADSLIPDSLIPDSLIPDSLIQKGEGAQRRQRATRLPSDFSLPDDWITFCITERPDLDPAKTFDKFRDYWTAKAGKDGAKLNWSATWRNWVREERKQLAQPAKQPQPKSFAERDREAGWARWEEMTNRIHPDRIKAEQHSGQVIDITPRTLEIAQ